MAEQPTIKSVKQAMAEFRRLERATFLDRYAKGRRSRTRFIFADNWLYDMKAIWAAAHIPPVIPSTFHSNDVDPLLSAMGIEVVRADEPPFASFLSKSGTEGMNDEEFEIFQSFCLAVVRPKQADFRKKLLQHYQSTCAISCVNVEAALEAAHVTPFASDGIDNLENGILLRADLHRLFDSTDLAIDPTSLKATFSSRSSKAYADLHGKSVSLPKGGPTTASLHDRWQQFLAAGL